MERGYDASNKFWEGKQLPTVKEMVVDRKYTDWKAMNDVYD